MRAERAYPAEPCAVCGAPYSKRGANVGRHHVDGDRLNNNPENIVFLCKPHHVEAHRRFDGKIGGGPRPRIARLFRDRAMANAARAAALRAAGHSNPTIAVLLGVHRKTVDRWERKYAI